MVNTFITMGTIQTKLYMSIDIITKNSVKPLESRSTSSLAERQRGTVIVNSVGHRSVILKNEITQVCKILDSVFCGNVVYC